MTADVAGWVAFDHQVEVAWVHIAAYWGVGADDLLVFRFTCFLVFDVELGGEGDVLADWEAEDAVLGWEFETVDCGVVGCHCLF